MHLIQRLMTGGRPGTAVEAESHAWVIHCKRCGHDTSIWDMGGVRYKAAGRPWRLARCGACRRFVWGRLTRREA